MHVYFQIQRDPSEIQQTDASILITRSISRKAADAHINSVSENQHKEETARRNKSNLKI